MICNSLVYYQVFKGCFNQRDCNFDDVSTSGLLKLTVFEGLIKVKMCFYVGFSTKYIKTCYA